MKKKPATKKFMNVILAEHNNYRRKHCAQKLQIDAELNKYAQVWANFMAKNNFFDHRPDNPYGENLYVVRHSDPNWIVDPVEVVEAWYNEVQLYTFGEGTPHNFEQVGHFTQMVWRDTKKMGVGLALSESKKFYVVCNYDPPGNIFDQFPEHVRKAKIIPKT